MSADDFQNKKAEEQERKQLKENLLRMVLTSDARQRLSKVKIVRPQIAQMVEDHLIQLASAGKLKRVVTDDELKNILLSLQQPKREFKIKRV
jgi:programmed cell death protein 5